MDADVRSADLAIVGQFSYGLAALGETSEFARWVALAVDARIGTTFTKRWQEGV